MSVKEDKTFGIISIDSLLKEKITINETDYKKINIPDYQRPYKWTRKNVLDLLGDINNIISKNLNYSNIESHIKYRIGTIILHDNEEKYDIVDGQQRILTLALIKFYIDNENVQKGNCSAIFRQNFKNKLTRQNIYNNYKVIQDWFSIYNTEMKEKFNYAFKNMLEVVIIVVKKRSEAFQLFDSQNTRGKALEPHDLLKAYHLREMKNQPYEMKEAVTEWENRDSKEISDLFSWYLYPILKWSRWQKCYGFTSNNIDEYKGITQNSSYTYAKRALRASPYFQMNEPFIAGNDFFEMVKHYCNLRNNVKDEIENNSKFKYIKDIFAKDYSRGGAYVENLFYCAVMSYYDKFHNFEELAIKKLFMWAVMLRIDLKRLGYDSINKYAIGEMSYKYTNGIDMFSKIYNARLHNEISNMQVRFSIEDDVLKKNEKWYELYKKLEEL